MYSKESNIHLFIITLLLFLGIVWVVNIQVSQKHPKKIAITIIRKQQIQSVIRGKELFKSESCNNCHKINKRQCPDLIRGITERRSKAFLMAFIKNEDSLIKAGNKDAIALKEEFNGANGLHNKKHLPNAAIEDIINYMATNK